MKAKHLLKCLYETTNNTKKLVCSMKCWHDTNCDILEEPQNCHFEIYGSNDKHCCEYNPASQSSNLMMEKKII